MRSRLFRRSLVVSFPLLALAAVTLSSGQQTKAAVGSSSGSTTGTSPSTTGGTGSTSGSTGTTTGGSGTTGGDPSAGWTVEHNPSGSKDYDGRSVAWGNPDTPGAWYPGGTDTEDAGIGTTSTSTSLNVGSSGSVGLRFTYTGTNAPAVSWVAVTSTTGWHSDNGSGSASNGLGAAPRPDADGKGQTYSSTRVYRVVGKSFTTSVSPSAKASVGSSNGSLMNAKASITVVGFLTDKSATLACPGNSSIVIDGNAYTADTLLSFDDSDGIEPGPNVRSLTGTYGGTWSTKADGTNDVNVVWSGTTGPSSPSPANATPSTYPFASAPSGKMPTADGSGSPKTQTWRYSVQDNGDGTEIDLTFKWVCHYPYENFAENAALSQDATTTFSKVYSVSLAAGESGMAHVDEDAFPAKTHFSPASWTSVPGFAPSDKHVGIPTYLARAGKTAENKWSAGDVPVTASQGAGDYGVLKVLTWPSHVGDVLAWNAKGEEDVQRFQYFLDTDSHLDTKPYFMPRSGM